MTTPVVHLIVGPQRHGVVRFGLELVAALRSGGDGIEEVREVSDIPSGQGVHLQFTDRLFGADAEQAVTAVSEVATDVHRHGGRITATLHDLPQPADVAHYAVRARAYATLTSRLDGVVVNSEHERILLFDIGVHSSIFVVPLPIAAPSATPAPAVGPASVGVFGFVYPDKGHADVLDAMQGLPSDIAMMALGEPSAGHDDLIAGLDRTARLQGRPFVVTGHVPDGGLLPLLQGVTVPVVHHRHMSASGSLNSWLSAGRRPLVPATRYIREIADRNPGALWLYEDDGLDLPSALRAALDEPSLTWLPPGTVCSPTPEQAAEQYRRLLNSVHG
jgi:glycosyltransferase involved in cell wall biosynthesis